MDDVRVKVVLFCNEDQRTRVDKFYFLTHNTLFIFLFSLPIYG